MKANLHMGDRDNRDIWSGWGRFNTRSLLSRGVRLRDTELLSCAALMRRIWLVLIDVGGCEQRQPLYIYLQPADAWINAALRLRQLSVASALQLKSVHSLHQLVDTLT